MFVPVCAIHICVHRTAVVWLLLLVPLTCPSHPALLFMLSSTHPSLTLPGCMRMSCTSFLNASSSYRPRFPKVPLYLFIALLTSTLVHDRQSLTDVRHPTLAQSVQSMISRLQLYVHISSLLPSCGAFYEMHILLWACSAASQAVGPGCSKYDVAPHLSASGALPGPSLMRLQHQTQ